MKKFTANKDGYNSIGTLLLSATIAGYSFECSLNYFTETRCIATVFFTSGNPNLSWIMDFYDLMS